MSEPTPKFLAWAQQANTNYEARRAAYRKVYPISYLEQLWKPTTMDELAAMLRRRPTGSYKL